MQDIKKLFVFQGLIFSVVFLITILSFLKVESILNSSLSISLKEYSIWEIIIGVIIASLILLLFIKFVHKEKLKKAFLYFIFGFISLWGSVFILSLWINFLSAMIISLAIVIFVFSYRNVLFNNIAMMLAVPAAVINLSIAVNFETTVLFLLILTIYDYIAVYKTRHMVDMAKGMVQQGVVFGFVFPRKTEYLESKVSQIIGQEEKNKAFIMGSGDVAIPLLFITNLLKYSHSAAIFVSFFAFLGLFLSFLIFYFQKDKQPMPALPPIVLMCFLGALIYSFV